LGEFILIAGPLVRASSWDPTARRLREEGWLVQNPDVLAHYDQPPSWCDWTSQLQRFLTPANRPIVVGHSSAGTLAVELATRISAGAVIVVDGDVPPAYGQASPVRPALRELIRRLPNSGGLLPIWSRWFDEAAERKALVGLDQLARDPAAFATFESELPRFSADWFDETIELGPWQHVPAGYVQTSAIYDHASAEAERRNWPVVRLGGTHLHPTIRPDETALTLIEMAERLVA
jgi:hypothetical protein